jgi:presenilin-like A22 family membrane protease
MKHPLLMTGIIILLFFLAQLTGLVILDRYSSVPAMNSTSQGNVTYADLPFGMERADATGIETVYVFGIGILIGTLLILGLIKFGGGKFLKLWLFTACVMLLTISFSAFIPAGYALILAVFFSIFKTFKVNVVLHNISEIFLYGGLAAMFVPLLTIHTAILLLLIISVYDAIAVWKIKHMVTMATSMADMKVFAGLFIPYGLTDVPQSEGSIEPRKVQYAMLGGGDIAFTLLFAGVVYESLLLTMPMLTAFAFAMIIPVFTTSSLIGLMMISKQGKFYPAMPFLTVGCLVGYGVMLLCLAVA